MKIAIASGKGGTGKTTLSTNLASYLAETQKVVLADFDVEEPNSKLFIQGTLKTEEDKFYYIPEWKQEACTLCDICHEVCNYNAIIRLDEKIMVFPQLCHSCYACSELCPEEALPMIPHKMGMLRLYENGNLSMVESRLDIGQEQAVPLIKQTHEFIDSHFDKDSIQIFDAPPGTSCSVMETVHPADLVILVTEPTPFGLHDLSLAVDTMREMKKSFGVVINRYGIGDDAVLQYCEKEHIPILATIPNSREIATLYSNGNLLYDKVPAVKEALEKIVGYIEKMEGKQ